MFKRALFQIGRDLDKAIKLFYAAMIAGAGFSLGLILQEAIQEGQEINDAHAAEYADAGAEIPQAADFFEIVEVED